ncbi:MAG: DNA primase [Bacilli bacterium]
MKENSVFEDVIKHSDIVQVISSYLSLTKKGRNYYALCPFHDDKNPSMIISPEKQLFKCFVCGTGGNAIVFVQKFEKISYFDAAKKVAEICDYHDPRLEKKENIKPVDKTKEELFACIEDLSNYYQLALSSQEGKIGLEYFENRKIDSQIQEKFLLGYSFENGFDTCSFLLKKGHSLKTLEDIGISTIINGKPCDVNKGRVVFSICDSDGRVVGFSARRLNDNIDEPKYVNSPETKLFHKANVLYNFHNAKDKARQLKYIYVLEGFMDVIALEKIGIQNAVALMGTALTNEHIALLRSLNCEIRLCLDGDMAGQMATMRICDMLSKANLAYRIVEPIEEYKDADEILNHQGKNALKNYLNRLIDKLDYALSYYQKSNSLNSIEDKKKVVEKFVPIITSIKDSLIYDSYIRKLSKVTGFDIDAIRDFMKKAKSTKNVSELREVNKKFNPERKQLARLFLAEKEILYQMLKNPEAIQFYEKNEIGFYDEIYRSIANFLVDYVKNHEELDVSGVISVIEESEIENKNSLINSITEIYFEKYHPQLCSEELLNDYLNTINVEKQKIFENDTLNQALKGKDPLDQARIISNFNRRRANKLKENK